MTSTVHLYLGLGGVYRGKLVANDVFNDLALFKIETDTPIPRLSIDTTSYTSMSIITIGAPNKHRWHIAHGTLSLTSYETQNTTPKEVSGGPIENSVFDVYDLSVYPGSSGSPVISLSTGKVIGVIVALVERPSIGKVFKIDEDAHMRTDLVTLTGTSTRIAYSPPLGKIHEFLDKSIPPTE